MCIHRTPLNVNRNWTEYNRGFGDKEKDFWIGNDQLHQLTKSGDKKLRVELEGDGRSLWAEYDNFIVEKVYWAPGYRPRSSGFSGNVSISYSCNVSNCMKHCPSFKFFPHLDMGQMTSLYYIFLDNCLENTTMWIMNK